MASGPLLASGGQGIRRLAAPNAGGGAVLKMPWWREGPACVPCPPALPSRRALVGPTRHRGFDGFRLFSKLDRDSSPPFFSRSVTDGSQSYFARLLTAACEAISAMRRFLVSSVLAV